MFSKQKNVGFWSSPPRVLASALSGCSSKDDELDQFIADTKKAARWPREPLPELKPYESYAYESASARSPFMPGGSGALGGRSLRPDSRRNREFLEQFSLDTLRMVGTLRLQDRTYGLIKTKDGLVHRVLPGTLPGPGGRPGHRNIAFEDKCRGNSSRRAWRLHGTACLARLELKIHARE